MVKKCNYCLYTEQCNARYPCEYFASIYDAYEDIVIDKYIENERIEFREYWFELLEDEDRLQDYFG